jgi:hypothetical protein
MDNQDGQVVHGQELAEVDLNLVRGSLLPVRDNAVTRT